MLSEHKYFIHHITYLGNVHNGLDLTSNQIFNLIWEEKKEDSLNRIRPITALYTIIKTITFDTHCWILYLRTRSYFHFWVSLWISQILTLWLVVFVWSPGTMSCVTDVLYTCFCSCVDLGFRLPFFSDFGNLFFFTFLLEYTFKFFDDFF